MSRPGHALLVFTALISKRNLQQECRNGVELGRLCHAVPANLSPSYVARALREAPPLSACGMGGNKF